MRDVKMRVTTMEFRLATAVDRDALVATLQVNAQGVATLQSKP
jgi:hypothetical protein